MKQENRLRAKGLIAAVIVAALFTTSCTKDFESFNTVSKLRVLGIAGTPPALNSGETAVITAMVAPLDSNDVSYQWSWCPFSMGNLSGYGCSVNEAQFFAAIATVAPDAAATFPPFDLGTAQEATFFYGLDAALLKTLCELALTQSKPDFVTLPSCDTSLTIQFTLVVTDGEETVTAVKELSLLLDDSAVPNGNPSIGAVTAIGPDGTETILNEDAPTALLAGTTYEMHIDVPESASETFTPAPTTETPDPEPAREVMFMTWFVEAGETEFERTGFIEGDTPFENLGLNSWYSPSLSEAPESFWIHWVLQDERGGAVWTSREITVQEAP